MQARFSKERWIASVIAEQKLVQCTCVAMGKSYSDGTRRHCLFQDPSGTKQMQGKRGGNALRTARTLLKIATTFEDLGC